MNKSKKLILWDIDGTLMHCGADGTKALNETFRKLYGVEDAFSKAGIGHAMDAVILDRILENNGLSRDDLQIIKTEYIGILDGILKENANKRILPGIRELLESVHQSDRSFNALLTSNLQAGAETKLRSVGLDSFFSVGGYGDDYGEKWDAAQKGIREAEAYYGAKFEKENIYIVGDSIYDIKCAKKLQVVSIGVATGWAGYDALAEEKPDYLYDDLSDWKTLLEKHDWK